MNRKRRGAMVIPAGMILPEPHEIESARAFTEGGIDVEFIVPSRTKGIRTPDLKIYAVLWELKCPTGSGKMTIQTQLKRAVKQSHNVILDTSRTKLSDGFVEKEVKRIMRRTRSVKRLIIINKRRELIEI